MFVLGLKLGIRLESLKHSPMSNCIMRTSIYFTTLGKCLLTISGKRVKLFDEKNKFATI